ncbi:NACHT%2C LRR and PYD domains-containing protein 12-like isoform X2, partial [Scomber scombrus]
RFSDSEGSLVTWSGYQKMVGCVEEKSKSESPASTFESKHPPPDISDEAGPSHIKEENTPNRATPDGHEGDGSNLSSHPSTSNTTLNVSEDSRDDEEEGFRPNMLTESDNISYRFSCPGPGVFRCNLTGLMFVMTKKAELQYWTVQWDERVLQPAGKTAAGPLFNIQSSPEGAVSQLHLPHCETMDAPLPEGLLSVVHITDDGMSILKLLHITDTHVVVKVLHLSAFGLVTNDEYRNTANRSVNGQVLLFLQKPQSETQKQYLDVFLLPRNVPLSEVIARHQDVDYIKAPPRCQLIVGESYSVDCPEAALIQPDKAVFDLEFEPNYHPMFEIRLPTNKDKMTLKVQDQTNPEVWKYEMDLKAPRRRHLKRNLPAKRDKMAEVDLIKLLDDLSDDKFEDFRWFLKKEKLGDIEPIPWAKLENAKRRDIVDLMVQKYELAGAVEVMKSVLQTISRNDLVKKLSNISSGAAGPGPADSECPSRDAKCPSR